MYYQKKHKDHDCEEKRFVINKQDRDEEKDKWDCDDHDKHKACDEKNHDHKDCVGEVLEAILRAQKKVSDYHKKCSSCKDSIHDLLEEPKKPSKNTIPFILYCGCEPFKATGVTTYPCGSKDKKLACITSYIFRISGLKDQCAELELLAFKPKKDEHKKICSPCDQIECEHVDDLVRTGICITVDLSCFCAVTCLPAVRL